MRKRLDRSPDIFASSCYRNKERKEPVHEPVQQEVFFFEILKNLQMKILLKMPNEPLCRMRRTCSFLDQTVEENNRKFSRRIMDGVDVCLYGAGDPEEEGLSFGYKECRICYYLSPDFHYEKFLSGLVIRTLGVNYDSEKKEILKRLKVDCENLSIHDVESAKDFLEIVGLVNCRKKIIHESRPFHDTDLPLLIASKYRLKMEITLGIPGNASDLFDEFKNLRRVHFRNYYGEPQRRHFESLMQHLYNISDTGDLERMRFRNGSEEDPFEKPNQPLPPSLLLWKRPNDIEDRFYRKPYFIRFMDMPRSSNCVLCVVRWQEILVYLLKKDLKAIFDKLATILNLSLAEVEEQMLLDEDKEKQMNALRSIFTTQMVQEP